MKRKNNFQRNRQDRVPADSWRRLTQALVCFQRGEFADAEKLCREILLYYPNNFETLHLLGVIALQTGQIEQSIEIITRAIEINASAAEAHCNLASALQTLKRHEEAVANYDKAIALRGDFAEAYNDRGNALRDLRRFDDALASCYRAITLKPSYAEAHNDLGTILQDLERPDEALASYDKAIALQPGFAEAYNNRGNVLRSLARLDEALRSYKRAIALQPQSAEAYINHGNAMRDLKRFDEAVHDYDKAITLNPRSAEAHSNRGNVLQDLKRLDEAVASYDRAIALQPDLAASYNNRGNALRRLQRLDEAFNSYDRAVALQPDFAEAYANRGNALRDLRCLGDAVASYDRAIVLQPHFAEAYNSRGNALRDLKCLEKAIASYDRAIALRPDFADAYNNRGSALWDLGHYDDAVVNYDMALHIEPSHRQARANMLRAVQATCDWTRASKLMDVLDKPFEQIDAAFSLLLFKDEPRLHLQSTKLYINGRLSNYPPPLWNGTVWHHEKIRVAYLSADFHGHATAYLIAGLLESHDRSRFEVIGVSFGRAKPDGMRSRLLRAFDQFYEVDSKSDLEVAKLLSKLEIDIAIDLKGYTEESRPEILAHRPAPIQVSYLGYPGTMGAKFIDYVLADPIVLPFDQQPFYTEKIVHLPECYQVNDSQRIISTHTPFRSELGLPDRGFVFCSFNNNHKISAPVFDIWMRLLRGVEGSVLWLLHDNAVAARNLRVEAASRGVDPARLVFADRVPLGEHLARHRLADLFLDTLPYNAHTTASDALWTGLPVLTCLGRAFAGRVAASLLHAVGLSELVTESLSDYEALASKLARDESLLGELREKVARNRLSCTLFDTNRACRHIEFAYITMWQLWQQGEGPRSFRVEPHQLT